MEKKKRQDDTRCIVRSSSCVSFPSMTNRCRHCMQVGEMRKEVRRREDRQRQRQTMTDRQTQRHRQRSRHQDQVTTKQRPRPRYQDACGEVDERNKRLEWNWGRTYTVHTYVPSITLCLRDKKTDKESVCLYWSLTTSFFFLVQDTKHKTKVFCCFVQRTNISYFWIGVFCFLVLCCLLLCCFVFLVSQSKIKLKTYRPRQKKSRLRPSQRQKDSEPRLRVTSNKTQTNGKIQKGGNNDKVIKETDTKRRHKWMNSMIIEILTHHTKFASMNLFVLQDVRDVGNTEVRPNPNAL